MAESCSSYKILLTENNVTMALPMPSSFSLGKGAQTWEIIWQIT